MAVAVAEVLVDVLLTREVTERVTTASLVFALVLLVGGGVVATAVFDVAVVGVELTPVVVVAPVLVPVFVPVPLPVGEVPGVVLVLGVVVGDPLGGGPVGIWTPCEMVLAVLDDDCETPTWRLCGAAIPTLALLWSFRRVIVEEDICMGGLDSGRVGQGP